MHPLLYLHYRATTSDPWIVSPPITVSSPDTPAGALPIARTDISTGVQALPPANCLFSSDFVPLALDNYLALSVTTLGLLQSEADALLDFLINFKNAAIREAKYPGYLTSDFVAVTIGQIEKTGAHGSVKLSARLTNQISF